MTKDKAKNKAVTIIDRGTWIRGTINNVEGSYLLVGARNRCCVGFFLRDRGIEDKFLSGIPIATGINTRRWERIPSCLLHDGWLKGKYEVDPYLLREDAQAGEYVDAIYNLNDRAELSEKVREAQVAGWFAIFADTEIVFDGEEGERTTCRKCDAKLNGRERQRGYWMCRRCQREHRV